MTQVICYPPFRGCLCSWARVGWFAAAGIAEASSLQLHTSGDNTHPALLMEMKTTLFFLPALFLLLVTASPPLSALNHSAV